MKNNAKAILRQNGIFYLTGLLFILGIKLFTAKLPFPTLNGFWPRPPCGSESSAGFLLTMNPAPAMSAIPSVSS